MRRQITMLRARSPFSFMPFAVLCGCAATLPLCVPFVPVNGVPVNGAPVHAADVSTPTDEQLRELSAIHRAGLSRDRARVGWAILALDKGYEYHRTALLTLGRIGAEEALPALERLMTSPRSVVEENVAEYARVTRARILAQKDWAAAGDRAVRARAALDRYLKETGLTPERLNEGTVIKQRQGIVFDADTTPFELRALREMADMIYQAYRRDDGKEGDGDALATEARRRGINFGTDYAAAYKLRFGPMTRAERVRTLVDELSQKAALRGEDYPLFRLAGDEGAPAAQAAADRIQEMRRDLSRYPDEGRQGLSALVRVIFAAGDPAQAPFLVRLRSEKAGNVPSDRLARLERGVSLLYSVPY